MTNIYTTEILCVTAGTLAVRFLKVLFHIIFKTLVCNFFGLVLAVPETFCMSYGKLFG